MPIHIEANIGDVAESVILVGDPDRATFIAKNYLENPVCYNHYRHMYGYTGTYKGKRISVQTAGMGSPSISIVLEELNIFLTVGINTVFLTLLKVNLKFAIMHLQTSLGIMTTPSMANIFGNMQKIVFFMAV